MPGISFLFKKKWHPQSMENQKQLFLAEQAAIQQLQREKEAADEIAKENEMRLYEKHGDIAERDPRQSSLKFMYSAPKSKDNKEDSDLREQPKQLRLGEDDELVTAFKNRLKNPHSSQSSYVKELQDDSFTKESGSIQNGDDYSRVRDVSNQTTLEKEVGMKGHKSITNKDILDRYPILKNAPVDGKYNKDPNATVSIDIHAHKPFNEVLRNVQCLKCHQWGHKIGDRECKLKDITSESERKRQIQQDPSTVIMDTIQHEKQRLILRHSSLPRELNHLTNTYGNNKYNNTQDVALHQLVHSDDEDVDDVGGDSDPEGDFLATLSSKEKRLLLHRLKVRV